MKKYILLFMASTLAIFSTGCVSTAARPLSKSKTSIVVNSSLTKTTRPIPDFADFKPSNAMFGAIGGMASVSSGNDIIRTNSVVDPAIDIALELAKDLESNFNLKVSTNPIKVNTTTVPEIVSLSKGQADYILDVQTVNWSCVYLPLNWMRYRVIYSVKIRVIEATSSSTIAEGFYAWQTPDNYEHPTYEELFADGAKELRKQLDIAKAEAIKYFKSEILK